MLLYKKPYYISRLELFDILGTKTLNMTGEKITVAIAGAGDVAKFAPNQPICAITVAC
jgi:hypothetical protein